MSRGLFWSVYLISLVAVLVIAGRLAVAGFVS